MKKVLWAMLLAVAFVLSACSQTVVNECGATVIDFVFTEDNVVGFRAIAAVLETDNVEVITLFFDDIPSTQTMSSGTLEIVAGADGKRLASYTDYAHTFMLSSDTQITFKLDAVVAVRQLDSGIWTLNDENE